MMRWLRKAHIYIGIVTAAILILVTVTGVLLIHKKALGLNEITLNLPGYAASTVIDAWDIVITNNGQQIVATKQGVFKYTEKSGWLMALSTPARRLYLHEGTIYACVKNGLQESKDQGNTWRKSYTGREVLALHFQGNELFIATAEGVYRKRVDSSEWVLVQSYPVKMPEVRDLVVDGNQITTVAKEGVFVSQGQSTAIPVKFYVKNNSTGRVELQKVIKDLHTGEFFGHYFYWVMDAMSIGFIIVTVSGIYLWNRSRQLRKPNS